MPRFFFHMWTNGHLERDAEGITFGTLEEARIDAEASLFEMASDTLARGKKPDTLTIDISDETGAILAHVTVDTGS